jgi:hypothetical protein
MSPQAAKKNVEEASADLQNALLAGASPSDLARLRTGLAAAQLAESYALSGVPQAPTAMSVTDESRGGGNGEVGASSKRPSASCQL